MSVSQLLSTGTSTAEMNQDNEPPEHYLGRGKDGLLTYDRFTTLRRIRTTTDCLSEQYIATGLRYDRCCVTLLKFFK